MIQSNSFRYNIMPTLKRAIARFGGAPALCDYRVLNKILEHELPWFHPNITQEEIQQAMTYLLNFISKPRTTV